MRFNPSYLFIIIPLLIGIFLTFMIGKELTQRKNSNNDTSPTTTVKTNNISEDEKKILDVPSANATEDEKRAHYELAVKNAKKVDFLDLTTCQPSPLVMRVKLKENFKIKNSGNTSHTIVINQDHTYKVPEMSEREVMADFGKGAILYGYGCDDSPNAVGFLYVSEE